MIKKSEKLADYLVAKRKPIFVLAIVLCIMSCVGVVLLITSDIINYDLLQYLDPDSSTGQGIEFLQENFGISGNAIIVVSGTEEDEELAAIVDSTAQYEGVTSVMWYGMLDSMRPLVEPTVQLFGGTTNFDALEDFLRVERQDNGTIYYDYVIVYMFDYSPSTNEAFELLQKIETSMTGRSIYSAGMTPMAEDMMTETMNDFPYFVIFSLLVVLILLMIFMNAYFEPVVLILTLGMAILVNMATNLFLPSVSFISFCCSSVLQLGITMDYAIFYMHIYREQRAGFDRDEASRRTLPLVIRSVTASSLTTMIGFCALYTMSFSIGGDIANVIVKGVGLSLLTVLLLQPALTYSADRLIMKTTHKQIKIPYDKASHFIVKHRWVVIGICMVLVIPAVIGSSKLQYSYLKISEDTVSETPEEELGKELGNQVIIALPIHTRDDALTHADYIAELQEDDKVGGVMSAFTALDMPIPQLERVLAVMGNAEGLSSLFARVEREDGSYEWYTLYTVSIIGDTEGADADRTYQHIVNTTNKYFDSNYPLGILTGAQDMKQITAHDMTVVTLFSVLAILILVSIMFRSVTKGVIMVLVIELAIWLNFALSYAMGEAVNFMIYIIISSIQLGCTVDYAILIASKYEQLRQSGCDAKTAAAEACSTSLPAVMLSALIIICACMTVNIISDNIMIKQLTFLMSRGSLLSFILVSTLLPCLLTVSRKINIPFGTRLYKKIRAELQRVAEGITSSHSGAGNAEATDGELSSATDSSTDSMQTAESIQALGVNGDQANASEAQDTDSDTQDTETTPKESVENSDNSEDNA